MRSLLAITAATLIASSAGAVTVFNGSFESGVAISAGSFTTLTTGDTTSLTGWEVLSEGIDYIGGYWQASEGSRSLDLSALTSGGVKQTLTGFTVGKRYVVSFDLSGNPDGGDNPKRAVVSVSGGLPEIYKYTLSGSNSRTNMLWQTYTYSFVAGATAQDIQFRSLENNPSGITLDNVSISLVPEPASWGLMLAGFAMTGFALRRRRQNVVAA